MSCSTCQKIKSIPECSAVVVIGTVSVIDADLLVIFKEIKTGREIYVIGTTDGDGELSIDLTDVEGFFSEDFEYELKVLNGDTLDDYEDVLPVTIDEVEYECLLLRFKKIYNGANQEVEGADNIILIADV